MITIKRILCPIDFSDFSRSALDHAIAIAHGYDSTITLLHVLAIPPVAAYAPGSGALPSALLTQEDRDTLLASMRRFAEAGAGTNVPIEFDIAEGSVAGAILAKAEAMKADLLTLGTHGRSGFARLVLGSVTERVLRQATCPVLTVPKGLPDAVPAPPALFKKIVCGIDFSDSSMHALNYAMSLAEQGRGALIVVHVIEPLPVGAAYETALAWPPTLSEYIESAQAERKTMLNEAIPDTVRTRCTVDTVLATGKPYREIVRVAESEQADLLVIGVHGHGPIDRLLFGSTAEHLVRMAPCPVLTLRSEPHR